MATTVNVPFAPWATAWSAGCVVMAGASVTVSVAAVLVAVPVELVATARYLFPSNAAGAAVIVSVAVVAPL